MRKLNMAKNSNVTMTLETLHHIFVQVVIAFAFDGKELKYG